jgi:Tfp pilus assembly PilM family ATPase/Tfp pilus assembly protein PilN
MQSKTWGLDIGKTGIKAVEVTRTLRGPRVTNYGVFSLNRKDKEDSRTEIIRRLREVLSKLEGKGEDLVYLFPSSRTMVHRIPLPFRDRKKNQQVVKFEVEPFLPFSADQVVVDFYSAEKDEAGKEALVFAARKGDLGESLSLLKEAGLDPERVVPEALALFWLIRGLGKTSEDPGALLDLGLNKATLILWQGDRLNLARSIPMSGGPLTGAADPNLARLAEEVKRTFLSAGYSAEGQSVKEVYLTGGGSLVPGVDPSLSQYLGKPVSPLALGEAAGEVPGEHRPVLCAALGAAWGDSSADWVNLRREEFAPPQKAQRARGRLKILISYGVILGILGAGSFLLDLYRQERKYGELKAQIRKEFSQALPEVKRVVNELQQMKARVQEEKAKLGSLGGGPGGGSPLEVLREVSLMVDPGSKVRVTELLVDSASIEVNGEADSFETVNQLKVRLDRSGNFKEVQLKTARASSLENVIEFKFQMKQGAGG